MGKKQKRSQYPRSGPPTAKTQTAAPNNPSATPEKLKADKQSVVTENPGQRVQPEQMSLTAHAHIQAYLQASNKSKLHKDDVTAVLRLAQHLRVFGLLSAVGYLNQSNEQEGKVRERTKPVWKCLLGKLIDPNNQLEPETLTTFVVEMAENKPSTYLATWRRSLILANHWNFWARAYQEESCTQNPHQTTPTPESN